MSTWDCVDIVMFSIVCVLLEARKGIITINMSGCVRISLQEVVAFRTDTRVKSYIMMFKIYCACTAEFVDIGADTPCSLSASFLTSTPVHYVPGLSFFADLGAGKLRSCP